MGFAVYHMEKGRGGSGGIGRHIDRIESKYGYNTYEHSDPSKRELNQNFVLNDHCKKALPKAIEDRIKEGYTQSKEIRKDAVKFQTHILTGSHEEMKEIFSNKNTSDKWIQENIDWMCEKYGKENIVRFTLHMDERTPHIHAITVPITEDGRLSAKSYADGKKALRDIQTDYAKRMEQFGLERGLERAGVKHESAQEYYARIERLDEYIKRPNIEPIEPKKGFFKTNIDEIYKQAQELSVLASTFAEELETKKRKIQELSNVSLQSKQLNRALTLNKDAIVNQEVESLTKVYQVALEEKQTILSEQYKILNNPKLLIERAKNIQSESYEVLLDRLVKDILGEAKLKIDLGKAISVPDVDDWIRTYSPKEKLGVNNPWEALNILTDRNRFEFETKIHKEIKELEERKNIEKSQEMKQEIKTNIEEQHRSKGRIR